MLDNLVRGLLVGDMEMFDLRAKRGPSTLNDPVDLMHTTNVSTYYFTKASRGKNGEGSEDGMHGCRLL